MGCAFLSHYQLLSVGDKISFHLLKSSSPLHTTSSARKELRTIVDVLVVMKASSCQISYSWRSRSVLLENSNSYNSLGWLWSVCAQNQSRSISLPCPDCGSQFLLKFKVNAKDRKSNLLLGEIHKLKNFKWGIFHPQRTALRVTLCHLATLNILLILSFSSLKGLLDH